MNLAVQYGGVGFPLSRFTNVSPSELKFILKANGFMNNIAYLSAAYFFFFSDYLFYRTQPSEMQT